MKHSLTAMLAIVSTAGFAGVVQAQTTATTTTAPSPGAQMTAPYNQYQSTAAPTYQTAPTTTPTAAPQANLQQPTTMQQPTAMPLSTASASASGMLTGDDLMQAQQQLQAQGLYRGPIDGVMGGGTRRALARFQRENGLPVTARLDQQTLDSLSGGGVTGTAGPSMGASTPPIGARAPMGTTAPLGTGSPTSNSPSTTDTQSTATQPNASSQPATR